MVHLDQRQFLEVTCSQAVFRQGDWQLKTQRFIREELADYVLTDQLPTIRDAAKSLGVSVRALQRNLAREGSSFSEALDEVRAQGAIEELGDPRATLLSVAFDLGYTDQSNFNRAFRRWFGMNPTQFRSCDLCPACRTCKKLATCLKEGRAQR